MNKTLWFKLVFLSFGTADPLHQASLCCKGLSYVLGELAASLVSTHEMPVSLS